MAQTGTNQLLIVILTVAAIFDIIKIVPGLFTKQSGSLSTIKKIKTVKDCLVVRRATRIKMRLPCLNQSQKN